MRLNLKEIYDIVFDCCARGVFGRIYPFVISDEINQNRNQNNLLLKLLNKIKHTEIGKKYNIWDIVSSEDFYSEFLDRVPIFEYKDYKEYIELSKTKPNIIWPWKIKSFSASSWTTDTKKHIPVTKESMKSTTKVWTYMFADIVKWYKWLPFLRWKFFPLTWTIQQRIDDIKIWDVSALILLERKWITGSRNALSNDVLLNPSWEDKLKLVYDNLDVGNQITMVWVTSWAYEILNYFYDKDKKKFNELVSNMRLIIWWWVDVAPYMHYFKKYNIKYIWAYNASEWYFGYQDIVNYDNSNWDAPYKLLTNHWIFYEFLEFNSDNFDDEWNIKRDAKAKPIWKISKEDVWKNYALVITTNGWLLRYLIWDVISFIDDKLRFKIVWRTRQSINLKWEELMETHINKVIDKLSEEWINITYYTIWPDLDDWPTRHEWVIELADECKLSNEELTKKIDELLQKINPDYYAKRKNDMLLKLPIIHVVKKWTFYQWLKSNNRLWSQVKVPKLSSKRDKIEDILKLI